MINTKERNQKITNLIESVIRDHCRIYDTVMEISDDGMLAYLNDELLYYIRIEFNDGDFDIHFNGFVFSNLPISQVIKLKEIHKEDDITEFLTTNSMELWFLDDEHLLTKRISTKEYSDYSILNTAFAIELYEQINNTVTIKSLLNSLLEEREVVATN